MLTYLVFAAALSLESLGSYISVVGMAGGGSTILMVLAIVFDFSKVVIASVLYKNWKELNVLFKVFLLPVLFVLIGITSYGAYGYLLQEFTKTTENQVKVQAELDSLKEEREKLQLRKKEIDKQVAEVPPQFVSQKKRLTDMFEKELTFVNDRVTELDKKIPELNQEILKSTSVEGTSGVLAKAWGTTPDQASKFLALVLSLMIDPLAIVMLTVGNFLVELKVRRQAKENKAKVIDSVRSVESESGSKANESVKTTEEGVAVFTTNITVPEGVKTIDEYVKTKKQEVDPVDVAQPKESGIVEEQASLNEKVIPLTKEDKTLKKNDSWVSTKPKVMEPALSKAEDPFRIKDINEMLKELPEEDKPKIFSNKS